VILDKKFHNLLFQQEVVAAPVTATFFFLAAFLEEDTIRNIIILYINYKVMCINNKNSVINNSDGRLQELILLFKIPMGT